MHQMDAIITTHGVVLYIRVSMSMFLDMQHTTKLIFILCWLFQGKISFKNLKRVAKELGENMTDEELQEMIDEADRDGDFLNCVVFHLSQLTLSF